MRQSSDVHERVLSELFASARASPTMALDEEAAQGQAAAGRTGAAAPAVLAVHQLQRRDPVRAGILRERARSAPATASAIRNYIISIPRKYPTCWKWPAAKGNGPAAQPLA
jgi:phosphoenolpyruvate carboxylase